MGDVYAIIGAALAVALTGMGSAIGMAWVQQAAAGLVSEKPNMYPKTLILQLIPSSNALYGFVVGFLIVANVILGGEPGVATYTETEGMLIMFMCLPIAIVGLFACLGQAKVCVSGIKMIGRREELGGRAITMAVFIELFALFALIVSILGVLQVGGA